MKIKFLILTALLLTFVCVGSAQTKKTAAAAVVTADAVVKNLYAAHDASKSPFFQAKNRALLDKFFVKELADMIWKDAVDSEKEQGVGAIDFDPLYDAQDTQITNLVIEKPRDAGGSDNAFVKAAFKNYGKAFWVDFELLREAGKGWKISGVSYSTGDDLASILRYSQDAEFRKEFDENQTFIGEYMVGNVKCNVVPTLNGLSYRLHCEDEEDFKLYQVEGDETETAYIHIDEKGVEKGRFVFKNGDADGKFIDASGKEVKVSRIKQAQ